MNGVLIKNEFETKAELMQAIKEAERELNKLNYESSYDCVIAEYWENRLESLNDFIIEFVEF